MHLHHSAEGDDSCRDNAGESPEDYYDDEGLCDRRTRLIVLSVIQTLRLLEAEGKLTHQALEHAMSTLPQRVQQSIGQHSHLCLNALCTLLDLRTSLYGPPD